MTDDFDEVVKAILGSRHDRLVRGLTSLEGKYGFR